MNEFPTKIDRLIERLHHDITRCDQIEERACIIEERLSNLNISIQNLARIIEMSFLLLISSDKEKIKWLEFINNENLELTNPIREEFFYRLECYLQREMIDINEKQAYIQALVLLQSPFIVSSGFLK